VRRLDADPAQRVCVNGVDGMTERGSARAGSRRMSMDRRRVCMAPRAVSPDPHAMDLTSTTQQGPIVPAETAEWPIDPGVRIGHVHLRTADIDRVKAFYVGVLGFDVVLEARDVPGWGTTGDILFLAAGGYHHHLGFNTWKSAGGPPQPDGHAGLHHVALNYPTRASLGDAVRRLREADWPLRQVDDHGTHLAIYLSDPDGNDLELAWDRPFAEWPRDADGHAVMAMDGELDVDALVAGAPAR
jgi:catechol 2,3-dioxygenase